MPLNPTGSEIPRSLTQIGTTIDAALNGKADFVRITANPSTMTAASSYAITGSFSYDGTPITGPASLDFVSANSWANSDGETSSLSVESGKWRLIYGDTLPQGSWLSVETTATRPENCTWAAEDLVSGTPVLTFNRATVATTGQFALVDDGVYDPVMWQNLGTDNAQEWVALVKPSDLSSYATTSAVAATYAPLASPALTGNPTAPTQAAGNSTTRLATTAFVATSFAPLASPALTGTPTAPTQASGNDSTRIATTAFVAEGFVPRITSVDNRLTRFDGTTGAVQSSGITVDDNNRFTGVDRINENVSFGTIVFVGGGAVRAANGTTVNLGNSRATSNDNFANLFLRNTAAISFGPDSCVSEQSAGVLQVGTTANNASGSLALTNLTASGVIITPQCRTSLLQRDVGNTAIQIYNSTISSAIFALNMGGTIFTNSTGTVGSFNFATTYNQTGTAGSTDIQINRTETALGSGTHRFIDFQVGGSSRFSVSNTGNVTASGTLRVGGGTVVANILSATATLDFPSISSNGTETLTITVTGAVAGDSVFLGCPAGLDAGLIFCASVTAANTVTVRMHNSSGGSVDPASGTFRATVIRF